MKCRLYAPPLHFAWQRTVVIAMLFLASCTREIPVFRPVSVEVPVTMPCRTPPVAKPDFAMSHISSGDDLALKTKAALMELDQRRAYETEMEAQVEACR